MAIQMTRAEYEAKYGVRPVIPKESTLDTTPAPRRMTRAEYEAEFGVKKPSLLETVTNPAKEAIQGLGQMYGGGEQGIANKLKQDVLAGAQDIEQGNVIKGLAKSALRTSGDVAGLVFAPIGAVMQATGFNKLTDYVAEKFWDIPVFNELLDSPKLQEFAMTHPNAEEDFGRALNLAMSLAETGKIEPRTIVDRTIQQVKGIVGTPASEGVPGTGIRGKLDVAKEVIKKFNEEKKIVSDAKVTKLIADELYNIENNYATIRKANEFSTDANAASRARIAATDVLATAVDAEGRIRTTQPGGAVDQYRARTIDGLESVVKDNLIREAKKVNLIEVSKELKNEILNSKLEGGDLVKALNGVEAEIKGLKLRADPFGNVDLSKIQDAKVSTYGNINFNTPPETATYRKAVARTYKNLIESKSDFDVRTINKELQKYYQDVTTLQRLDGRVVKGGKLGKYFARTAGNVAGAMTGGMVGGPAGIAVGTVVGGEISSRLQGRQMSKAFGKATGREIPKNPILESAKELAGKPADLKVPDVVIGAPKGIKKTPEIFKIEKDIRSNVEMQKKAIKANDFTLVKTLKEIYTYLVEKLKKLISDRGGFIDVNAKIGGEKLDPKVAEFLRESKGLSAADIMSKNPDISLKKDVIAKDIHGDKVVIPEGEVLTPYELKGNKVLLQDGETYVVSKNQFQNIKGQAMSSEVKDFAPELKGVEETVKGGNGQWKGNELYDANGEVVANLIKNDDGTWSYQSDFSEGSQTFKTKQQAMETAVLDTVGDIYGKSGTKYSSYQLPEGKNYKEILIKAPEERVPQTFRMVEGSGARPFKVYIGKNETHVTSFPTRAEAEAYVKNSEGKFSEPKQKGFKSSHWDEPNVIAHLRLNERTYKGKKVMFMEELQSDWAREGRKATERLAQEAETYKRDLRLLETTPDVVNREAKIKAIKEKLDEMKDVSPSVPNNPLLKNWQTLSVKRALKEAVDNNSDYFSWINGEQTSARYNLATHLDNVKWGKTGTAKEFGADKIIKLKPTNSSEFSIHLNKDGTIIRGEKGDWKGKKLDEVLGKGLADKIMEKESGTLSGEGLKFGGEWANNLYDKQVGNIVKDLTGAKVETLDLGLPIDGSKKVWMDYTTGKNLTMPAQLKIGNEIRQGGMNNTYIITDILGDGKFKAVPKQRIDQLTYGKSSKADTKAFIEKYAETFDVSTKKTTQQGIKLTPEIKALIKGEKIELKKKVKNTDKAFQKETQEVMLNAQNDVVARLRLLDHNSFKNKKGIDLTSYETVKDILDVVDIDKQPLNPTEMLKAYEILKLYGK
jgi:hypothetical protein